MDFSDSSQASSSSPSRHSRLRDAFLAPIQDKVAHLYYRHGLICSRHPWIIIFITVFIICFCCHPIIGIHYLIRSPSQPFTTTLNEYNRFVKNGNKFTSNFGGEGEQTQKAPFWVSNCLLVPFPLVFLLYSNEFVLLV